MPKRRCDKCTPMNKKAWGCEADIRPYNFFGEVLTRCPLRMVLEDPGTLNDISEHYAWFERGAFPAPGTWYDQSPVWIELMSTVKAAHAEADAYEADKAEQRRQQQAELAAMQPGRRGTGATGNGQPNS